MLASIWLRLSDEEETSLRMLIAQLADAHGTMPFQPHLTVCSPQSETSWNAAAEYVRRSKALPIHVGKKRISFSTTAPMRAVVIEVENTPDLRSLREDLRLITGAVEPPPPHISLLYAVDETGRHPSWSSDHRRLRRISGECAQRVNASEFILGRPVIVAPDSAWTNIKSWRLVCTLSCPLHRRDHRA
jgi:2'-5' RNA ligase